MKVFKSLVFTSAAFLMGWPTVAIGQQASFDCSLANTPAEHLICGNKELATLDTAVASAYSAARNAPGADRPGLQQQQREWLKQRASGCGIPDNGWKPEGPQVQPWTVCLANQYRQRLAQLGQAPASASGQPTPHEVPATAGSSPAPAKSVGATPSQAERDAAFEATHLFDSQVVFKLYLDSGAAYPFGYTMRQFEAYGKSKGHFTEWETIDDMTYVLRIIGKDPVTKRSEEFAFVFSSIQRQPSFPYVLVTRMVLNDYDLNPAEMLQFIRSLPPVR